MLTLTLNIIDHTMTGYMKNYPVQGSRIDVAVK